MSTHVPGFHEFSMFFLHKNLVKEFVTLIQFEKIWNLNSFWKERKPFQMTCFVQVFKYLITASEQMC